MSTTEADEMPALLPALTRREVLGGMAAAAALAPFPFPGNAFAQGVAEQSVNAHFLMVVPAQWTVNGNTVDLLLDPRTSLLDAMREQLGIFGPKKGCDHGQCGACTVMVDGKRVVSCLMPAVQAEGSEVLTIEGLADGETLHPVQAAFIECDAMQCGYCTPGQIMSAVACIKERHADNPAQIREYMSGNLCRCGAYTGIVRAVEMAKAEMEA